MSSEHTSHSTESTSSVDPLNGKYGVDLRRVTGMSGGHGMGLNGSHNINDRLNLNNMNGSSGFSGLNGHSSSEGMDRFANLPRMNGLSLSDVDMNGVEEVSSLDLMLKKLEACRRSDTTRESIVQSLVEGYQSLKAQLQDMSDELDNERLSRKEYQKRAREVQIQARETEAELENELRRAKQQTEANPFVLALIDGDGAVFQEALLRAVINGGTEAGHLLYNEIKQHVQQLYEGSGAWSVMVQIYANFDGLARHLHSIGILSSPGQLNAFAKSFNLSQPLFNFIDVGSGKERADYKIREMFRLFVSNAQCKHIIFGGCHDNGYLTMIKQYQYDQATASRITLLETTPAERQYRMVGMPIIRFDSVFRNEPLDPTPKLQSSTTIPARPRSPVKEVKPIARAPTMEAIPIARVATNENLPLARAATVPTAPAPKQPTIATATTITPPTITSYATKISSSKAAAIDADGFHGVTVASKRPTLPDPKIIHLNAIDQRIDPKLPAVDSSTKATLETRIANQKVCNNFHLLNKCQGRCPFDHEPMSAKMLLALRHKARERVCPRRSGCRQADCLSGHMCPWRDCDRTTCFFRELHGIDTEVRMKMDENGRVDPVR